MPEHKHYFVPGKFHPFCLVDYCYTILKDGEPKKIEEVYWVENVTDCGN